MKRSAVNSGFLPPKEEKPTLMVGSLGRSPVRSSVVGFLAVDQGFDDVGVQGRQLENTGHIRAIDVEGTFKLADGLDLAGFEDVGPGKGPSQRLEDGGLYRLLRPGDLSIQGLGSNHRLAAAHAPDQHRDVDLQVAVVGYGNGRLHCVKNRVAAEVEEAILTFAHEQPAYGQLRVANELAKRGILISPAGVRWVWLRHGLETIKKRLKALKGKVAQDGIVLTEEQVQALEKAKLEKESHGEIETQHPGYLGVQDTYYVGHIKGVGRIYQQTFIDTYSNVAMLKLYTSKISLTATDMLKDRVIPWFDENGIRLLRILTDRGTEYCGNRERHEFQLYLNIEDIDHTRTKAKSLQTNGICERFHQTVQNEFYAVAFRKKSTRVSKNCKMTSIYG